MAVRFRALLRFLTVLLLICSWLGITNHCALAAWSSKTTTAVMTASCPMHRKPAQHHRQGATLVCCKILRAPGATATIKAAVPTMQLLAPDQAQLSVPLLLASHFGSFLPSLDTGPPVGSFAESVLQRSLLAHGPPSLG